LGSLGPGVVDPSALLDLLASPTEGLPSVLGYRYPVGTLEYKCQWLGPQHTVESRIVTVQLEGKVCVSAQVMLDKMVVFSDLPI